METFLNYSRDSVGCPEVIAYSTINSATNNLEMKFYNSSSKTNYTTKINPSINDIIPIIQIGDILSFPGHTFLIYDVIKDSKGKVIDTIIMESGYNIRNNSRINSKISETIKLSNGKSFGNRNHFLFLNKEVNTDYEEGLEQGTVQIGRFATHSIWLAINNTKTRQSEYSILRFIQNNSKKIPILTYKTVKPNFPNSILNNQPIILPDKTLDRLNKFSHIYIEKTINKINNNIVEIGDILNYRIIIRNMGKKDYNEIIVTEYISNYVKFENRYENRTDISFNFDFNNNKLQWNIRKLNHGEEIIISYFVKIINGNPGDIIESIGFVGNIPSSNVKNIIGINLDKNKMKMVEQKYEKLKNKYNGKKLINEIYKEAFNYDLKFDEFDLTKLVVNKQLNGSHYSTLLLNKTNIFYTSVLNKYLSSLIIEKYGNIEGKEQYVYDLKGYGAYNFEERRQDFIYSKIFRTGDILIYKIDANNNLIILNNVTYEEGEYSFIYIDGKGFVGINLGEDGIPNTKDDRNEFNSKYYSEYNLKFYINYNNGDNETLEMVNYQTLFGKDYYVILRPSLAFDLKVKNDSKTLTIILSISATIVVVAILLLIFIRYKRKTNNLIKGEEDSNLLTQKLF